MLFNTMDFIVFFPIVAFIYFVIPQKIKHIWLLLASYYFYMCWNAKYALLLLFSTAITYISGLLIDFIDHKDWDNTKIEKYKKFCVAGSFGINLMILFLYKYFDFFIENINKLLIHFNMEIIDPGFSLLLPVGISFYIFQALSYTMDVYRKDIYAEKNFLRYALFVSFFPQLVAGPIERSKNLLRQMNKMHQFDYTRMRDGLLIVLAGYFQKLVIADRVAIFIDTIYGNITSYQGLYLVVASVLFAVQIYCDFSGYSLIAIGTAKIMGFTLMDNFQCPYMARSVSDFWRRWHISLTSWFRDYLYIPLGGNRKGTTRKYLNIMIVFLVSGLWHGAEWTFIIWGGLNGLFQVIGSLLKPVKEKVAQIFHINTNSMGHHILQIVVTFILVDITWIFFRADNLKSALQVFEGIFSIWNPWIFFDGSLYTLGLSQKQFQVLIISIGILAVSDILVSRKVDLLAIITKQDLWFRWLFYIVGIMFVLIFGVWGAGYAAEAFVYFQF